MRGFCRILILLLVVAVLPLRGYAAVAVDLCAAHHGGAAPAHAVGHDHGHDTTGPDGDQSSMAAVCGLCSTCSVGASFAPEAVRPVAAASAGADRIPFFDARKPGHVPDHPHRPPLVS